MVNSLCPPWFVSENKPQNYSDDDDDGDDDKNDKKPKALLMSKTLKGEPRMQPEAVMTVKEDKWGTLADRFQLHAKTIYHCFCNEYNKLYDMNAEQLTAWLGPSIKHHQMLVSRRKWLDKCQKDLMSVEKEMGIPPSIDVAPISNPPCETATALSDFHSVTNKRRCCFQ
jgi:hypothetical protein